jgi:hypothetical protein
MKTRFATQKSFCAAALFWLAVASISAAPVGTAFAADNQTPSPPAAVPSIPPQPAPAEKPGFLHQLKVWWDASINFFDRGIKDTSGKVDDLNKKTADTAKDAAAATQGAMKNALDATKDAAVVTQGAMKNALDATKDAAVATQGAMKGAVDVTKDAAGVIVRLPNTRVVEVHERCEKAPNGAPDCATAANNACRSKGFNGGQPIDVRTGEKCDTTAAALAGQSPGKGECPIESWITRAICQ